MNVFIIGPSRSGKTTLSQKMIKDGYNHIQASKALKIKYPQNNDEKYTDYVSRLSSISKDLLVDEPNFFIDYIRSNMKDVNVIEGIRNPRDFCFLYNPNIDRVILTEGEYISEFETLGIKSILTIIDFWKNKVEHYNYRLIL